MKQVKEEDNSTTRQSLKRAEIHILGSAICCEVSKSHFIFELFTTKFFVNFKLSLKLPSLVSKDM
jgi:hypothetical protein